MSPRVSLVIPSGDEERGLGFGGWGWQFNLPVSKQVGDFYLHGNAGRDLVAEPADRSISQCGLRARRRCRRREPVSGRERHLPRAADVQSDARERGRLARGGRGAGRDRPQHGVSSSRRACAEDGTSATSRSSSAWRCPSSAPMTRPSPACSGTSRTSCRSSLRVQDAGSRSALTSVQRHQFDQLLGRVDGVRRTQAIGLAVSCAIAEPVARQAHRNARGFGDQQVVHRIADHQRVLGGDIGARRAAQTSPGDRACGRTASRRRSRR